MTNGTESAITPRPFPLEQGTNHLLSNAHLNFHPGMDQNRRAISDSSGLGPQTQFFHPSLPNPYHPGFVSHMAPSYSNYITPEYLYFVKQLQTAQNAAALDSRQQTRTPAGGMYGPNGVFIPSDRVVRPPATNRIAPLFAQSGAWQTNNQHQSLRSHTGSPVPEWLKRKSTPFKKDDLELPYRENSDDMYRQNTGSSVEYQQLTRNGPPQYQDIVHAENIPFTEAARALKPAQWGVLKLGNVSNARSCF